MELTRVSRSSDSFSYGLLSHSMPWLSSLGFSPQGMPLHVCSHPVTVLCKISALPDLNHSLFSWYVLCTWQNASNICPSSDTSESEFGKEELLGWVLPSLCLGHFNLQCIGIKVPLADCHKWPYVKCARSIRLSAKAKMHQVISESLPPTWSPGLINQFAPTDYSTWGWTVAAWEGHLVWPPFALGLLRFHLARWEGRPP